MAFLDGVLGSWYGFRWGNRACLPTMRDHATIPMPEREGLPDVTPPVAPTNIELIRKIAITGGRKYTAGNIDRRKYQRLVALGRLTAALRND
jgi:hypothetical protein